MNSANFCLLIKLNKDCTLPFSYQTESCQGCFGYEISNLWDTDDSGGNGEDHYPVHLSLVGAPLVPEQHCSVWSFHQAAAPNQFPGRGVQSHAHQGSDYRDSADVKVAAAGILVRTRRKWQAQKAVDRSEARLRHSTVMGTVTVGRAGLYVLDKLEFISF